jgi:hypothetical protein
MRVIMISKSGQDEQIDEMCGTVDKIGHTVHQIGQQLDEDKGLLGKLDKNVANNTKKL